MSAGGTPIPIIGGARVSGKVSDATGGVLPGVTVTVTSLATNQSRTAVTNGEGIYRFAGLMPGRYSIAADLEGFSKFIQSDVALQVGAAELGRQTALQERFAVWSGSTIDLPGAFYRQAVLWLFKENRLAQGRFVALGRQIDLGVVRHPLFLVAASEDEVVPLPQLMAVRDLVGTRPQDVESVTSPGNHLSLFVGADTLRGAWSSVAGWLAEPQVQARAA